MLERAIRAIAGSLVIVSLALGYFVHPGWYFLTAFVGVNLVQSSITRWCLMEDILKSTILRQKPDGD